MSSWSELCVELLELIVNQFSAIEDVVRFRAVCQPWRSVPIEKQQFSPRLMLVEDGECNYYSLYGPLSQKVCRLNLPEACGLRCSTSGGWLITHGFDRAEILLVNPFSHEKIWFPPIPRVPSRLLLGLIPQQLPPEFTYQLHVEKLILSSSPKTTTPVEDDEKKCVVMVITTIRHILAFLRKGDKVWTMITTHKFINDVFYFHGQFYAVTSSAELLMVDISSPQPKTIEFADGIELLDLSPFPLCYYLVESAGKLFLLARYLTMGFRVFKFNFDGRRWTQVTSLDNCAMFVGAYTSFSIFPSNKFEWESNCIYFNNDNPHSSTRKKEIGVFRVDTRQSQDFFTSYRTICHACTALLVQPSL